MTNASDRAPATQLLFTCPGVATTGIESVAAGSGGTAGANVNIAELGSDDDAREALDYVRKEALKPPCFAVCSTEGKEFAVTGIPGAKGVQQTPLPDPPPDAPPPFASYGVGFTIGSRLYLVGTGGGPGQVKKDQVLDAAEALYKRNAKSDAAS